MPVISVGHRDFEAAAEEVAGVFAAAHKIGTIPRLGAAENRHGIKDLGKLDASLRTPFSPK